MSKYYKSFSARDSVLTNVTGTWELDIYCYKDEDGKHHLFKAGVVEPNQVIEFQEFSHLLGKPYVKDEIEDLPEGSWAVCLNERWGSYYNFNEAKLFQVSYPIKSEYKYVVPLEKFREGDEKYTRQFVLENVEGRLVKKNGDLGKTPNL